MSEIQWWDGTGVTVDALYDEVVKLATERPNTVKNCRYSNAVSKTPECIVGEGVYNITGKLVSDDDFFGQIRSNTIWRQALDVTTDYGVEPPVKFQFVAEVQRSQDNGYPWGGALSAARNLFPEL